MSTSPLSLVEVTLREIELPLRERFVISSGWMENRRILLLELRDESGVTAWSECVCGDRPNYSPETVDTAWLALGRWLLPRLLGREIEGPESVGSLLDDGVQGHPMAKAAIEMGMWGLAAETMGVSLSRLVGGTRSRVPTGISLGLQASPAELVAKALQAVEDGYRKVKLKISREKDIEYVAAVREALGPDRHLAVDANAAYTLEDADHLARLDEFGLIMIEQPLAAGDLVRHARLQERLATPICLDESIVDPATCEDMLALGSGRIVNIKPGRVGGFRNARRIHDISEGAGVPVWCGGMLESGIGRAYNVALASMPNFELPGDLSPSARYWARDIVTPEWTMSGDGFVTVPRERPGLGVVVDTERVEALTRRVETFAAPAARTPA
ncbi:o-succinylbenzoate synthase [Candidatus Palauibacter sp.]|uniref:o-succinylbenzoate synthase n=1 Tax=Candidatus Palauibacter sp. TaxID=3101350 RepID=UPI003B5A69CC